MTESRKGASEENEAKGPTEPADEYERACPSDAHFMWRGARHQTPRPAVL